MKTIYIRGNTSNPVVDALRNILMLLLFPIILAIGLIIMFFAGLLSLGQRLTSGKKDRQIAEANQKITLELQQQWSVFTSVDDLSIQKQFAGSLPWDSGDYFYLYSRPEIAYFEHKLFGDWLYVEFNGVFLQCWNDITATTCNLIFIDAKSLKVIELLEHIPTRNWIAKKTDLNILEFTFETEQAKSTYSVDLKEIDGKRRDLHQ